MSSFKFPPPPPPPPKATLNDPQTSYDNPNRRRDFDGPKQNPYQSGHGNHRGGFRSHESSRANCAGNNRARTFEQPAQRSQASQFGGRQHHNHLTKHEQASLHHQGPSQYHHAFQPNGQNKRKRDINLLHQNHVLQAQPQSTSKLDSSKPSRVKAAVAPAVPSFGFSLPPVSNEPSAKLNPANRPSITKSKVNLGLTSQYQADSDTGGEDDEEVDEENLYASKMKLEKGVVFEHNGEKISLQTAADVMAWRRDRRDKFPTAKRIFEKREERSTARAAELRFLRKVKGKMSAPEEDIRPPASSQAQAQAQVFPESPKGHAVHEDIQLQSLRRKVANSIPVNQINPSWTKSTVNIHSVAKPLSTNLGISYKSTSESDDSGSSVPSDSSVISTSEDSSDEDANENDIPEARSSKLPVAPVRALRNHSPRQDRVPKPKKEKPDQCHHWEKYGTCKYGDRCRLSHKAKSRIGLYESLVEQELEKADRLVLDAIKYLGQNGFLG